jgi:hypothetical protein
MQADWRCVLLVVCQQKMVPTNIEQRPNELPLIVVADVATPHRLSGPVGLYPLAAFDNHIGQVPPDSVWRLSRISPSSSFAGFATRSIVRYLPNIRAQRGSTGWTVGERETWRVRRKQAGVAVKRQES